MLRGVGGSLFVFQTKSQSVKPGLYSELQRLFSPRLFEDPDFHTCLDKKKIVGNIWRQIFGMISILFSLLNISRSQNAPVNTYACRKSYSNQSTYVNVSMLFSRTSHMAQSSEESGQGQSYPHSTSFHSVQVTCSAS